MTPDDQPKHKSTWLRDLLTGFLVWILAFALYMVPAFVVAIPMGFDLGPKLKDSAEVGRLISQTISEMYRSNPYFLPGFILLLALLIFWRSRVIIRKSGKSQPGRGAVIATLPVILTGIPMGLQELDFMLVIAVVLFFAAGLVGATRRTAASNT